MNFFILKYLSVALVIINYHSKKLTNYPYFLEKNNISFIIVRYKKIGGGMPMQQDKLLVLIIN